MSKTARNGVVTTPTFTPRTGLISGLRAGTNNAVAAFDYQLDLVGNLTQRTDGFTYDSLNRLSTCSIAGGAMQTMGYDALGNITSKPGVGTCAYPAAGQPRPHAVSAIAGTVRGVTNPTFSYDGDGEQTAGPGVAAGYTSFDRPAWVSSEQGGNAWGAFVWGQATWSFTGETLAYDSGHQRVSMSGTSSMTCYFNDPVSGMKSELGSRPAGRRGGGTIWSPMAGWWRSGRS